MTAKTRLEDLAADDALFGLDAEEAAELASIASAAPSLADDLQLVAARLTLFRSRTAHEPLPAALRAKVQARAFAHFEDVIVAPPPTATTTGVNVVELAPAVARRRRPMTALLFAAAACLVAGVGLSALRSTESAPAASPVTVQTEPTTPLTVTSGALSAELHASSSGDLEVVAFGLSGDDHALYLLVEDSAGARQWIVGPDLVAESDGARVAKLARGAGVVGFAVAPRGLEASDGALAAVPLRAVRGESPRVRAE